jgi:hypothetical protein
MAQGTAHPVFTDLFGLQPSGHILPCSAGCRAAQRPKARRARRAGKAEAGGLGNMMSENGEQSSPGGA